MRSHLTLLRWLGPWAQEDRAPTDVERAELRIEHLRAWRYQKRGRRPTGALLVCPGIHYAGPADPRLDRFNRILASAGLLVLSPFLPDFTRMIITERVIDDLDAALGRLLEEAERPGLLSISFGSLPVLRVAARPDRADRIRGLFLFGGYADFHDTVRHCLSGEGRDPLNQPVVLMNLLADLPEAPLDPEPLLSAWRAYMEATWGRPEMKARARFAPIAERIEKSLDPSYRRLFRTGVGLEGDALALCAPALERRAPGFLDPRPHLAGIRCPVHLCHGLDDDVIPVSQVERLASALPAHVPVRTYVTGLYGHTGSAGLSAASAAAREGVTLLGMLRAIIDVTAAPLGDGRSKHDDRDGA